jgi:DNA polymerase delta subunit 1
MIIQIHDIQLFNNQFLIFGRNAAGESVSVNVKGHPFSFYIKPREKKHYKTYNEIILNMNIKALKILEKTRTCTSYQCDCNSLDKIERYGPDMASTCILRKHDLSDRLVWFDSIQDLKTMLGYQKNTSEFIKVYCQSYCVKKLIKQYLFGPVYKDFEVYEFDIDPVTKFMADLEIVGFGHIELKQYKRTPKHKRSTRCKHEFDVKNGSALNAINIVQNFPVNLVSFDIECISFIENKFPQAKDNDPIIQIALVYEKLFLENEADEDTAASFTDAEKVVLCLNQTDMIDNAQVLCYETEGLLLKAFFEHVVNIYEADVLAGYNSNQFDIPYILDRAKILGLDDFLYMSKLKTRRIYKWQQQFESAQSGVRVTTQYNSPGIVFFDLFNFIKKTMTLQSYTLNFVAEKLLNGEKKEDMHYGDLAPFFSESSAKRAVIASYCLQDTVLVSKLIFFQKMLVNNIQFSRICGVLLNHSFEKGVSFKILRKILEYTKKCGFVIPNFKKDDQGRQIIQYYDDIDNDKSEYITPDTLEMTIPDYFAPVKRKFKLESKQIKFQGAFVLNPVVGYHEDAVVTLDFASLYPSEMRMHNMCTSTLLQSEKHAKDIGLNEHEYEVVASGYVFVKKTVFEGILPKIESELFEQRKSVKKEMKRAAAAAVDDKVLYEVLDAKQLAIKLIMNSIYGFCGSRTAALAALPIAVSITAQGRHDLMQTKQWIEKNSDLIFNDKTVKPEVIYGDSDSVFVKFHGIKDVELAAKYAHKIEMLINNKTALGLFELPMYLEFEKIFLPFFLLKKKKYVGLKYAADALNKPKFDYKGIETARRDWSKLCTDTQKVFLDKLVKEKDKRGALDYVRQRVVDLMEGTLDENEFVLSKKLSKFNYKNKQPHVEVAMKLTKIDPPNAPKLGDRVNYYIALNDQAKIAMKAQPMCYFNKIEVDLVYYLKKQLETPLSRLIEPLVGKDQTKEIFKYNRSKAVMKKEQVRSFNRLFKI